MNRVRVIQRFYAGLFVRTLFLQSLWNFERLQNIGFLYVLYPFLKKMYPDKEKRKEVLLRHIGFFNSNPYMANVIIAMVLNCENSISKGKNVAITKPNMIKTVMAGPVSAIGDSFFWGIWKPFCVFVAIFLFMLCMNIFNTSYVWIVPVSFILLYNVVHLTFRYWLLFISFRLDERIIPLVSRLEISFLGDMLRVIGVFVVIGSLFLYFKLYGFVPVENLSFLGYQIPEVLVFGLLLLFSFLLARIKSVIVFYCAIIISFILGYLEIIL